LVNPASFAALKSGAKKLGQISFSGSATGKLISLTPLKSLVE